MPLRSRTIGDFTADLSRAVPNLSMRRARIVERLNGLAANGANEGFMGRVDSVLFRESPSVNILGLNATIRESTHG
jgi:hypothetical protein